jgi:hypothetical protein
MWQKSYSKTFPDVTPEDIWNIWTDINNWHTWNPGIEYCKLDKPFAVGNFFTLKPQGASAVQIKLVAVEENHLFTDCTRFPGAKMYGRHEMEKTPKGLKLTTTMTITGPLEFLWRKIVGEKIVAKTPQQTEVLVARARKDGK